MKTDKINNQEQEPYIRVMHDMLKRVKVPEKNDPQWSVLETNIFTDLGQNKLPKTGKMFFTLRQASFVSYFAISIIIVAVFFFYPHKEVKSDLCARFRSVHGTITISSKNKKTTDTLSSVQAIKNAIRIEKGATVAALDNSSFIITIDSGSAMEVSNNSRLTFEEFDSKRIIINLSRGSILAKVSKRTPDQQFIVNTLPASCIVVGTIFKVEIFTQPDSTLKTNLVVYEGKVKFYCKNNQQQTRYVAAGQSCSAYIKNMDATRAVSEPETPLKQISTLELMTNTGNCAIKQSGIIDISSRPDNAMVMLDDSIIGKTPLLIRKPAGSHKITIVKAGYATIEKNIAVRMDSTSMISAEFTKSTSQNNGTSTRETINIPIVKLSPESTFVTLPDYVEAMIQLTIGEYQKALGILESIKENQPIDLKSRMVLISKINNCYAKIGNFSRVIDDLSNKIEKASTDDEKGQYLWELANVQSNCMGDFHSAELSLNKLIETNPWGKRTREAFCKLAEVQYMQDKLDDAVATYKVFLQRFPDDFDRDRSLFSLACIMDYDLNNYTEALKLYTKLIETSPNGKYYKSAIFNRADCSAKIGKISEARVYYKKYLALDPQGIWSSVCAERLKAIR
ncbi:MAG TPA: hypothetical protein DCO75_13255 [Fibrobacteres bacterium]|nr:hypothetical protein [Fibrobacterota bacterium]